MNMVKESYDGGYSGQQFFTDVNVRIRDLEDKQRILKDRMVLVGDSLIREREKSFREIQELKKIVVRLVEDNRRMKDILKRVGERVEIGARKEELNILQRQFDLFRGDK
jgi:adenine C2-methylase RlmN of 23S rRNA A2503 and tRNA A37